MEERKKTAAPEKPAILELEEARVEIMSFVEQCRRRHNLPCYLLGYIVDELQAQVQQVKQQELSAARTAYRQQVEAARAAAEAEAKAKAEAEPKESEG